jgi:hypothetical protein
MKRATILKTCLVAAVALSTFAPATQAITGNWTGQLQGTNGATESVTYRFSPTGNPVLRFLTRQGYKDVELRAVGQRQEWLLRGPGWARGTVEALAVGPDRVQAVVRIYTESGGGALLDQKERLIAFEFVQAGGTVQAAVLNEAVGYSSGNGLGLYAGSQTRNVLRGTLYPER